MLSKIVAVILAATSVIASPVAPLAERDSQIVKRGDGIHLVNCGDAGAPFWCSNGNCNYGAVVYCENDGNCNFNPAAGNMCRISKPDTGLYNWGLTTSCTFSTGASFSWDLQGNPSTFGYAGTGHNQWHTYNMYKDNGHRMYVDDKGNNCYSAYYGILRN